MKYSLILMAGLAAAACSLPSGKTKNSDPSPKIKHSSALSTDKQPGKKKPLSGRTGVNRGGKNGWTMFRGDRGRSGNADVNGPRTNSLKWVFRTSGRIYADVAISPDGETVYTGSHDYFLYAVGTDGRKKWSYNTGGQIWSSPAIGRDNKIFIGSDSDVLTALYPDGKVSWRFITTMDPEKGEPPPEAGRFDVDTSPLIMDDGTIVFGCHVQLFALKPGAGDIRWVFAAGTGRSKIFSSAAASPDGTIFFGTQGNYFFALNQSSKVIWSQKTGGDNDSTPVVDVDGNLFFASDDGIVRAVAPGNKRLWTLDIKAPVRAPLGLSAGGTLYAATYARNPEMVAIDSKTGVEKWRFSIRPGEGDFYGIQSGATTDKSGYVYFGGRDGYVYCLNPKGELVWEYQTGDQVDASPVLGPDGTLYIGSDDHRLYAFGKI
jgi:outer membrane protein assembly factor BamB